MKRYTVLLLRPDYAAATYGRDTIMLHVNAKSAIGAVREARKAAEEIDDHCNSPGEGDNYYPLLVADGHIYDITPPRLR